MRCISWTAGPDQGSCSFLVGSKTCLKKGEKDEQGQMKVMERGVKDDSIKNKCRSWYGCALMLHCNEFHSPLSGISPKCISIAPSTFALQRHLFLDKAGISWLSIYAYKVGPWVSSGQTSSFCNAYYLLALKSSTNLTWNPPRFSGVNDFCHKTQQQWEKEMYFPEVSRKWNHTFLTETHLLNIPQNVRPNEKNYSNSLNRKFVPWSYLNNGFHSFSITQHSSKCETKWKLHPSVVVSSFQAEPNNL
jgi:hypothetical protein